MFAISTQHGQNCRTKVFKGAIHDEQKVKYCQIPEWVMVSVDHKAWMLVRINFNGDTSETFATCNFPKTLMNQYLDMDKLKARFSEKMRKEATLFPSCWDDNGSRKDINSD
jgi:hypothetical protein